MAKEIERGVRRTTSPKLSTKEKQKKKKGEEGSTLID